MELNQRSTAIATLRQAMNEQSPTVAVATKLAKLQLESGKLDQARETIARAQTTFPEVQEVQLIARQLSDLVPSSNKLR